MKNDPTAPEDLRRELESSLEEIEKISINQEPRTATVRYNIHPDAVPISSLEPEMFVRLIAEKFSARFDDSEIRPYIPDGVDVSAGQLTRLSLEKQDKARFKGGVLRIGGEDRITPIESMMIGNQNIAVTLSGSTDEAEYLCKRLCIIAWLAAGYDRKWAELRPHVSMVGYTTTTLAQLPFRLRDLLAPVLNDYLTTVVDPDGGIGAQMGYQFIDSELRDEALQQRFSVSSCQSIKLRVNNFDRVSGIAEECVLDFLLFSKTAANRGLVMVTSELPSSKHAKLVEDVIQKLNTQ